MCVQTPNSIRQNPLLRTLMITQLVRNFICYENARYSTILSDS